MKRRSHLWWALGIPAGVILIMAVATTFLRPPGDGATLPGAMASDSGTANFSVQLIARSPDGGTPRVLAELPGTGEVQARASESLQVKFHPNPRGTRFFAVDEKGTPTALSEEVGRTLPPGRYQLFGLHDLSMTEAQAIEDAPLPWPNGALPVRLSERAHQAHGTLVVNK